MIWESGPWFLRQEHLFLIPGDSPMGLRLPLDSLPWEAPEERDDVIAPDPFAPARAAAVASGTPAVRSTASRCRRAKPQDVDSVP